MATVHKWPVSMMLAQFTLNMPRGTQILDVRPQGDTVCVWGYVPDRASPDEPRSFAWVATGQDVPNGYTAYHGTVHLPGPFVFHLFECTGPMLNPFNHLPFEREAGVGNG